MKLSLNTFILTENSEAALQAASKGDVPAKRVFMIYLSWLLVFSYSLLMLKPVMPVLADAVAHTFWEKQHLMSVHEVNGKFHVHYEIAKNEKQSNKDANSSQKDEINLHMPVAFAATITQTVYSFISKPCFGTYRSSFSNSHLEKDYPPPRVA